MPLFTDAGLIGISDLEVYESTLSTTASTHNINIETKTAITLASIGDRLTARLLEAGAAGSGWFRPANAGFLNPVTIPPQTNWTFTIAHVVINGSLRTWISYGILAQVFNDAYNAQLNDRFREKWLEYNDRAKQTEALVYELGIPVVYRPLAQPAPATVNLIDGTLPAGIVTVQTTWVDETGTESTPSPLVPVTLDGSAGLSVRMGRSRTIPPTAIGWNVYVGAGSNDPMKQNESALAANATWTAPAGGFVAGNPLPQGQLPDGYVTDLRRLQRG